MTRSELGELTQVFTALGLPCRIFAAGEDTQRVWSGLGYSLHIRVEAIELY